MNEHKLTVLNTKGIIYFKADELIEGLEFVNNSLVNGEEARDVLNSFINHYKNIVIRETQGV